MSQGALTNDLEAMIEAEYAALRRHFEERLAPLLAKRALLPAVGEVPSPEGGISVPRPIPADRPEPLRVRSPVARLVIEALQEAPGHRMYGADLTRIVLDAGFTRDSAEKVKTGLKKQGVLIKEPETSSWSLAPRFLEPGAAVPAYSTSRIEDPLGTRLGGFILEALTAAGEAGLAGDELLDAAQSRGFPRSQAAAIRHSLRAEGRIVCDLTQWGRWRIAGPHPGKLANRPPPPPADGAPRPGGGP